MKAPNFWQSKSLVARLLVPFSLIYGRVALARFNKTPRYKAHMPVLCVGNLVAGGAGKTPTAISLGKKAKSLGLYPVLLTRGYRGSLSGPVQVVPEDHTIGEVGDEALLLARTAPTIVAHDRVAGAKLAEQLTRDQEAAIIIMDDGYQNPHLYKDFNLVVIDANQSIGNGFVMPAGPLRAPLLPQVRRADQFVLAGHGEQAPLLRQILAKLGKAIMHAAIRPSHCHLIGGTNVLAFSGIGRPEKFEKTLEDLELNVMGHHIFGDHHTYSEADARMLLGEAKERNLSLVTTAKDYVRLSAAGIAGEALAELVNIVEVDMVFDDEGYARLILEQTQRKFSQR